MCMARANILVRWIMEVVERLVGGKLYIVLGLRVRRVRGGGLVKTLFEGIVGGGYVQIDTFDEWEWLSDPDASYSVSGAHQVSTFACSFMYDRLPTKYNLFEHECLVMILFCRPQWRMFTTYY
ncbi:hypothetical protein L195_g018022 [Trifolium pratense]|uniref:Uncharacterized protein n=1 Tax=Trifolium pratense TaxID=57577 RepID=A0A2K3MVI1_TRIPR|nr:hypothetical protein L195_g018022 [Trifolium pratense]